MRGVSPERGGMTLVEWRRFYAGLGLVTIPLRPREKRPLRKGWLDGREEHWAGAPADSNIGILTGARSGGLVVLDFDTRDGPEVVLGMTPAQLAVVTMVVETARGWHVYSRGSNIPSATPREGLDLRGEGGMVVAPPSIHPSGHEYAFVGSCREIIPLSTIAPESQLAREGPQGDAELDEAEAWIALQAPKLRDAWQQLKEPPSHSFDASKADFAVARCLWEAGYAPERVAALLMRLPGSRAHERGEPYALRTAMRARQVWPRVARD